MSKVHGVQVADGDIMAVGDVSRILVVAVGDLTTESFAKAAEIARDAVSAMRSPQPRQSAPERIAEAVDIGIRYGQVQGDHHKMWVIDKMLRVLLGDGYDQAICDACDGEDGQATYVWETGVAP